MKSMITLSLLLILSVSSCTDQGKGSVRSMVQRNYCTEIGRFDLLFYEDEISGSYALLPKQSLGAVWGKLDGLEMKGRWIDGDGAGDINITFKADFSSFTTAYRSDDEAEKWYTNWGGHLRPNQQASFSIEDKVYQCE